MRSTRLLFQRAAAASSQQFLLPPPSLVGSATAAAQGVWSHLTNASARERYEQLIEQGVIQDRVLSKADHGSMMTMALFHQLQNPLLEKHKLDPKEFLGAIPRAIEVYMDTLGCLVRELNEDAAKEKSAKETEDEALSIAALKDQTKNGINNNPWHQQAKENPSSLAGRLSRMATAHLLDEHWFGANLFRVMAWTSPTSHQYVPGSCHVTSVALLSARVDEVQKNEEDTFVDPDVPDIDRPIAAQWSVLYEMEQKFQQAPRTTNNDPILSAAEQYREMIQGNSSNNKSAADDATKETSSDDKKESSSDDKKESSSDDKKEATDTAAAADNDSTETSTIQSVTETSLVVAVLEAWIQKGSGSSEPFRWRVAHIRDAHEFR